MNVKIENLSLDNIGAVSQLHLDVFAAPPWNEHWELDWAEQRYRCILDSKFSLGLVLLKDSSLVGAIAGRGIPFKGALDFEICEFFISRSEQGAGLGKLLLSILEAELVQQGFGNAVLLTAADSRAHEFYRSQGYAENPELRFMVKGLRREIS